VDLTELRGVAGLFFPHPDDVRVVRIPKPGASGPRVAVVSYGGNGKDYALKYGRSRVPIATQLKNRKMLEESFGDRLVEVYDAKTGIPVHDAAILMAAYDETLHDAVTADDRNHEQHRDLWSDVLSRFTALWCDTRRPFVDLRQLARHPVNRIHKVRDSVLSHTLPGLERPLRDYAHQPILVNGVPCPSLAAMCDELLECYRAPKYAVRCHGDLNADNVLMKDGNWAMGDWEWCGDHDWRLSASHLVGWWIANAPVDEGNPAVRIDTEGRLVIRYDVRFRSFTRELATEAYSATAQLASQFGERDFERQFSTLLATLILGDIRFLNARGYDARTAIYLLGEASRVAYGGVQSVL
jgi:hypothetical protein